MSEVLPADTRGGVRRAAEEVDVTFLSDQGYPMCPADDPCPCGTSPMTYDGPQSDCLLHGDSAEMRALLDVLAWDVGLDWESPVDRWTWEWPHGLRSTVTLGEIRLIAPYKTPS